MNNLKKSIKVISYCQQEIFKFDMKKFRNQIGAVLLSEVSCRKKLISVDVSGNLVNY